MFTHSVVTFLIRGGFQGEIEVCLGLKKEGYSQGKYNGFGGKIEPGERVEEAAVRELTEEAGVITEKQFLDRKGLLKYFEPGGNWIVNVFTCNKWRGEIKESNEMKPSWFKLSQLPLGQMWENDALWIEKVLVADNRVEGIIWHDKNGKVIKHDLKIVRVLTEEKF